MSTTADQHVRLGELRHAQRAVLRRLERLRRMLRMHLLVEGVFWVGMAMVTAAAGSLLVDRLLRLEPATRWGLLVIATAGIGYLAWRRLVQPLLLPLSNLDLAELLDRRAPGVGQQIANVLQLPELLESHDSASPSMVRAAVLECAQALDRRDLAGTLNLARRRKMLAACGFALGVVVGFWVVWPEVAGLWARRWLAGSSVRWPQDTYLSVVGVDDDGTLLVPRGELAVVQINASPQFAQESTGRWLLAGRGQPLWVESATRPQSVAPEQVSIDYQLSDGSSRRGNATQFDESQFRYELPPLADPAELNVTGGDDWLGPIRVEPIDRPVVSRLEIKALRPGSSEPEVHQVGQGTAQLLFLPESQLELTLVSDQPLTKAEASDQGEPLDAWQRVDERTYTASWTMQEPLALEFRLVGQRGRLVSKPYFLAVGLLKDRQPRLTIRSSGVGRRVTPVARIPLAVRATDDFSLASLVLDWELTSIRESQPHREAKQLELETFAIAANAEPISQFEYDNELELRGSKLTPGNTLKLRGTATDACALGAQTGHSRWLTFQIVSADELFYDILMRQREQRARFAAALESAKAQAKSLARIAGHEELPGVARAQQVINRQVWQVATRLDATLEEMVLNDLANPQARENLQSTIITPMRKLHDDLLTGLRGSIGGLVQAGAIAEDRRTEAVDLADRSIEVMEAILAQMARWESFIDVLNQVKHIIEAQKSILQDSENAVEKRIENIFDE